MDWNNFSARPKHEFKSKSEKFISDLFVDAMTQKEEEPYTPQLRGSSLPICILLHAHELVQPHIRLVEPRLEHYAVQGTVFHSLFQKKLMYSKKWGRYVFGDFECPNCEDNKYQTQKYVPYRFQCRPKDYRTHKCPQCGHVGLRYRELEGKYKGVVGIHVDMVLKLGENRFWVMEFKTTGNFKINDPKMEFKPKHFHQASNYPIILNDIFGIKPEKFFIGYVNRDSPQNSKTSKRQSRWFPFRTEKFERIRVRQLDRIVAGESARKKYFENPTLKNLKTLDDLRPCKSEADYSKPLVGMKDRYESGENCPFIKRGKCGCFQTEKLSGAAKELHKIITEKKDG